MKTLPQQVTEHLQQIPALLQTPVKKYLKDISQYPYFEYPAFNKSICTVLASSDFIARHCIQHPEMIYQLFSTEDISHSYGNNTYETRLNQALKDIDNENDCKKILRQIRQREMVRIAWRDLAGWADLTETTRDLSRFADACIHYVTEQCHAWQQQKTPIETKLIVIAMGKLGGNELNFSSDIDIMFCHPALKDTSQQAILLRLAQQMIRLLNEVTEDGFVFRVDMRLRPNGDSGPLIVSIPALENYYQQQGRDWERYALIKARIVNQSTAAQQAINNIIHAFVYRRYVDFGVIDSLREIKQLISREIKLQNLGHNIKRGPGGIREIEFIAQAIQLIRGGKEPHLRVKNLLEILSLLHSSHILPHTTIQQLQEAYHLFRQIEHRLQMVNDQQTHDLPQDEIGKCRLAFSLKANDPQLFEKHVNSLREKVEQHFQQMFAEAHHRHPIQPTGVLTQLTGIWLAELDQPQATKQLEKIGFDDPASVYQHLQQLRHSSKQQAMSQKGKDRLNQFMPLLLSQIATTSDPDNSLQRTTPLVYAILQRSAYLSLLIENPQALSHLIQLCSASVWIANQLSSHPILLDELILSDTLFKPLPVDELRLELQRQSLSFAEDDLEQQLHCLRRFKHSHLLHIAAADLSEQMTQEAISKPLTDIAEVILQRVQQLAYAQLVKKHGEPVDQHNETLLSSFAIIAYGKLGGNELGYRSDLDLVFLHESACQHCQTNGKSPIANTLFYTRLAQRIINMLSMQTSTGALYQIDTRLRPSGNAGLLVSSIDAFAIYQTEQAWTWEHQALVRARIITGNEALAKRFKAVRTEILTLKRNKAELQQEIREMRDKMRATVRAVESDIRQAPGGIIDIEFITQYWVLLYAEQQPILCQHTDNINTLKQVAKLQLLEQGSVTLLIDAYNLYRKTTQHAALQKQTACLDSDVLRDYAKRVTAVWNDIFINH